MVLQIPCVISVIHTIYAPVFAIQIYDRRTCLLGIKPSSGKQILLPTVFENQAIFKIAPVAQNYTLVNFSTVSREQIVIDRIFSVFFPKEKA